MPLSCFHRTEPGFSSSNVLTSLVWTGSLEQRGSVEVYIAGTGGILDQDKPVHLVSEWACTTTEHWSQFIVIVLNSTLFLPKCLLQKASILEGKWMSECDFITFFHSGLKRWRTTDLLWATSLMLHKVKPGNSSMTSMIIQSEVRGALQIKTCVIKLAVFPRVSCSYVWVRLTRRIVWWRWRCDPLQLSGPSPRSEHSWCLWSPWPRCVVLPPLLQLKHNQRKTTCRHISQQHLIADKLNVLTYMTKKSSIFWHLRSHLLYLGRTKLKRRSSLSTLPTPKYLTTAV